MLQGSGDQNSVKFPDEAGETVGTSLQVLRGQRSTKKI